jgi:hypothetical protein
MSPEEVRVGRKIRVGKRHRIEERRGMVGTVVGRYGGEGYVRRSSNSLGMGRRRARPPKQAVVGPWCSWINSTVIPNPAEEFLSVMPPEATSGSW